MACITAEQASTTNIARTAAEKPVINHNKHALLLNNHQLQKQADIAAEKSSTT